MVDPGAARESTAFCDRRSCPTFQLRQYLLQLQQVLPYVPPVDVTALKHLYESRDHKGIVQFVKRFMNIEAVTFQVFWVPDGAASDKADAAAWVVLPSELPAFGSKEFQDTTINMYFRKSFFQQSYDRAAMVVAHELSHVVLESIRHPLRRCEKAVDLTAMLLGFSRIWELAAHKEEQIGNTIKTSTLGYLTPEEISYAARLLAEQQPQSKPAAESPRGGPRSTPVGLLAAATGMVATFGVFGLIVQFSGVATLSKPLIFGAIGVALSFAVSAYRLAHQFALTHPRMRSEVGRLALLVIGAGVLFGATEIYSKWQSQVSTQNARSDGLHRALLEFQIDVQQQLPKVVDEHMTLVATRVDGTDFTYVYNLTPRNFDEQVLQKAARRTVCSSNLKDRIDKGISYTFEYWDTSVNLLTKFQVTSCP